MRALILIPIALTTISLGSSIAEATNTHHKHKAAHHRPTKVHHRPLHAVAATSCGGTERWDVKDGSDAGASKVNPKIVDGITIADLNQLSPQPIDTDGRMQEEKVIYRISGVLRLFKHETDGDFHIVLADDATGPFSTGHSMVVEIPDPSCVAGAHHQFGASQFLPQLQESRSDFAAATQKLGLKPNTDLSSQNIQMTVVGVLFFDFMHGQTGHGLPHPSQDADTRDKVVEIHPVLCSDVSGYREQAGKVAC